MSKTAAKKTAARKPRKLKDPEPTPEVTDPVAQEDRLKELEKATRAMRNAQVRWASLLDDCLDAGATNAAVARAAGISREAVGQKAKKRSQG